MSAPNGVAVVILAAGASSRLGKRKQSLLLGHETLLDRSVRIANDAGFSQVVVVLGAFADQIRSNCRLQNCRVLLNSDWKNGMGTSIRHGIQSLNPVQGAVVMTCDMPAVTSNHLERLATSDKLTASYYANRRGVPAYFPKSMFPSLLQLDGDNGAKELLRSAPAIELVGGELDIDTAEDVTRMQAPSA